MNKFLANLMQEKLVWFLTANVVVFCIISMMILMINIDNRYTEYIGNITQQQNTTNAKINSLLNEIKALKRTPLYNCPTQPLNDTTYSNLAKSIVIITQLKDSLKNYGFQKTNFDQLKSLLSILNEQSTINSIDIIDHITTSNQIKSYNELNINFKLIVSDLYYNENFYNKFLNNWIKIRNNNQNKWMIITKLEENIANNNWINVLQIINNNTTELKELKNWYKSVADTIIIEQNLNIIYQHILSLLYN